MAEDTMEIVATGTRIREELSARGMLQKEFALRMGLTEKHVSKLINGEVMLTADVSVRLETVLGIPASEWNAMEARYRESLVRENTSKESRREAELAQVFPYAEMAKLGWVPEAKRLNEKVLALRDFFGVVDLELIEQGQLCSAACHGLSLDREEDATVIAWMQEARRMAWQIPSEALNVKGYEEWIYVIREWTKERPEVFLPKLDELLRAHGVLLLVLPRLRGLGIPSLTFPVGNRMAIAMTEKRMDDNEFWTRLLHEMGHIILEHVCLKDGTNDQDERDANVWARNELLSRSDYYAFKESAIFTEKSVCDFANMLGIAPGVLVGRLQRDGLIGVAALNRLKRGYMLHASNK